MTVAPSRTAPADRPSRLRPGSRVAVVAPSGPVPADRLEAGLGVLREWGLEPVVAPHVLDVHPELGYLAGTDADRAADLQAAWCDPAVDAVICARGGYGAHRMVDLVDWAAVRAAGPKAFVGYSDITVLHEAFALRAGFATLHGPMVATEAFLKDAPTREHLRATLFEPETVLTLGLDTAAALVPGRARGSCTGAASACSPPTPVPRTPGTGPGADCSSSRTPVRSPTGSTASSPGCCAPAPWRGCPGWSAAPGRSADRTRRSARCWPTGSARWGYP
ncbi:hypothetical protein Smic_70090 [Streptomyces microflavus]|uniref:LD-carboxypeptidase N-terminal domain-containing protein n=1 Tax=Streptomyces microflavus TaxID=1919 RepID=A0A7J0D135_STRMI|nr:hypothetical protein Smic_70090 [Streptomyces microflavus]